MQFCSSGDARDVNRSRWDLTPAPGKPN